MVPQFNGPGAWLATKERGATFVTFAMAEYSLSIHKTIPGKIVSNDQTPSLYILQRKLTVLLPFKFALMYISRFVAARPVFVFKLCFTI